MIPLKPKVLRNFTRQILAHQPNQSEDIWHFDVILPDVVSCEAISNDKQTSNENVRDKQASNEQDNNKKKISKKSKATLRLF